MQAGLMQCIFFSSSAIQQAFLFQANRAKHNSQFSQFSLDNTDALYSGWDMVGVGKSPSKSISQSSVSVPLASGVLCSHPGQIHAGALRPGQWQALSSYPRGASPRSPVVKRALDLAVLWIGARCSLDTSQWKVWKVGGVVEVHPDPEQVI